MTNVLKITDLLSPVAAGPTHALLYCQICQIPRTLRQTKALAAALK